MNNIAQFQLEPYRKAKSTGNWPLPDSQAADGPLLAVSGRRSSGGRELATSPGTGVQQRPRTEDKERRAREEKEKEKKKRRSMEEKAAKYAHLPVYNKEQEQTKAREREARLAQLFSGQLMEYCKQVGAT